MKINNKNYKRLPLSFNVVCRLEDMGISLNDIESKSMSMLRGYIAICIGTDAQTAGEEIEKHCEKGGDPNELFNELEKAIETSGFFQALEREQTETPAEKKKKQAQEK